MIAPPWGALFPANVLVFTDIVPLFWIALVLPVKVHPLTDKEPELVIPPPVEFEVRPSAMVTFSRIRPEPDGTLMTPWVFPPLIVTANPFPLMTVWIGMKNKPCTTGGI